MHDVQINPIKNRLYITLKDCNYSDLTAYVNQIENACKYLVLGFTCLILLNRKGLLRQSDKDLLFNTADLVYSYGASKIVNVQKSNNSSGFLRRSLIGFQTDFPLENAENIRQAEDILDGEKNEDRSWASA
jgi:hypothetical protein